MKSTFSIIIFTLVLCSLGIEQTVNAFTFQRPEESRESFQIRKSQEEILEQQEEMLRIMRSQNNNNNLSVIAKQNPIDQIQQKNKNRYVGVLVTQSPYFHTVKVGEEYSVSLEVTNYGKSFDTFGDWKDAHTGKQITVIKKGYNSGTNQTINFGDTVIFTKTTSQPIQKSFEERLYPMIGQDRITIVLNKDQLLDNNIQEANIFWPSIFAFVPSDLEKTTETTEIPVSTFLKAAFFLILYGIIGGIIGYFLGYIFKK